MFFRMTVSVVAIVSAGSLQAQQTAPADRQELYRFVMIQAAPGKLPDLLTLYRQRAAVITAGGDELPVLVRHSQGDRWDLLVIYPGGSFSEYYSRERIAKREAAANASGVGNAAFAKQFYDLGPGTRTSTSRGRRSPSCARISRTRVWSTWR